MTYPDDTDQILPKTFLQISKSVSSEPSSFPTLSKSTENKCTYEVTLPKNLYLNLMKPLYLSIKTKNVGHRGTSRGCNH